MRRRCSLAAVVAVVLAMETLGADPITSLERRRLGAHLEMTERWLVD